ncbi:hypothetical protein M885DRAFT_587177 [Pelagophyceae sp. CCMP2097]|nr:hypothetical protein M885DRAFT_587177 [Pelagophyceae sp. CCMP2097]
MLLARSSASRFLRRALRHARGCRCGARGRRQKGKRRLRACGLPLRAASTLAAHHATCGCGKCTGDAAARGSVLAGGALAARGGGLLRVGQDGGLLRQRSPAVARTFATTANTAPRPDAAQEAEWEANFAALEAYKATHKDCRVPENYQTVDGLDLGSWVSEQRDGCVTDSQAVRLEGVGFVWDHSDDVWDGHLEVLKEFATEFGHTDVPEDYATADKVQLGFWVLAQKFMQAKGLLTDEQESRLVAVGVRWDFDDPKRTKSEGAERIQDWLSDEPLHPRAKDPPVEEMHEDDEMPFKTDLGTGVPRACGDLLRGFEAKIARGDVAQACDEVMKGFSDDSTFIKKRGKSGQDSPLQKGRVCSALKKAQAEVDDDVEDEFTTGHWARSQRFRRNRPDHS